MPPLDPQTVFDVIVIGAGFAGMAMVNRLHENGLSVQGFEAGGDVGGTWYWNRYPGARCDVPSMEYSYRFSEALQQEWEWSERYAAQPEILRYANHVADRFDLRRFFRFNTPVERAEFDEASAHWRVTTADCSVAQAHYLITAVGCLSAANTPDIPGLDGFGGDLIHTARWPAGVDFAGKRVGVIGTGSSGVQAIPIIAEQAAEVTVFQRSAAYCVPARNRPLGSPEVQDIKHDYKGFRDFCGTQLGAYAMNPNMQSALEVAAAERQSTYEKAWLAGGLPFMGVFADLLYNPESNDSVMDFFRGKIQEIVKNPETAAKLMPKHRFGVKRLCVDTGYYETYNRLNVRLIDLSVEPIECVTKTGIRTSKAAYDLDMLVLATGFDAMTGPLLRIDIRGSGGTRLRDVWSHGAETYLGLGVAGFPNMFTLSGPGSPSVLTNMVYSIEQHVDWVTDCLLYLRGQGLQRIEAEAAPQSAWGEELNTLSAGSLIATGNSWYTGANIPGKPRRFMVHMIYPAYVARCEEVAAEFYQGFRLSGGI
jgi:cation diffusion facilitator CzcD-associated flavoprotein CzcO